MMQKLMRMYRSVNTQSLLRMYRSVNTQSLLRMYRSVNTQSLLRMYRSVNIQSLLKKGTQRLHCVKKLKSFSVCPKLLELLYRATVESTVAFNSPAKITKTASKWIGAPVTELQSHFGAKAVKRLRVILRDLAHPVQGTRRSDYSISNT